MIDGVEWGSLLDRQAPIECRLQAVLLTSFERPDERFLIEHLLPSLLGLAHDPQGDGVERDRFFVELGRELDTLRGRAFVITSMPTLTPQLASRDFNWLWNYVSLRSVGRTGRATQHAKLWMFHWRAPDSDDPGLLEIVISSANLTAAAFREQIQAAWRCVLPLQSTASQSRRNTWGILPEFLRKLGTSAGADDIVSLFTDLLGRCEAPEDVDFVASVPGQHGKLALKKAAWGMAGLGDIAPPGAGRVKLRVMAPFIGTWSQKELEAWCDRVQSSPDRIELVWIDKQHPWAENGLDGTQRWILPATTHQTFVDSDVALLRLEHPSANDEDATAFHDSHRAANDRRWSHAKLYMLRRGKACRLLVTSANFSTSAWGKPLADGSLEIRNFELGVALRQIEWPTREPAIFSDLDDAWVVTPAISIKSAELGWAQSVWDGDVLTVECRFSGDPNGKLVAHLTIAGKAVELHDWRQSGDLWRTTMPWPIRLGPPTIVQLCVAGLRLEIPTQDLRAPSDIPSTVIPEIQPERAQALRDELLLEEYGGVFEDASDDSAVLTEVASSHESDDAETTAGTIDSYAIPAFVEARRMMSCVDNWAARMSNATSRQVGSTEGSRLLRDGAELVGAFQRRALRLRELCRAALAIGSHMAAEELKARLQVFENEGALDARD